MIKPRLILIDGPIGAGKSTTAKLLHKKLKRSALISLDRIKHLLSDHNYSHPNKDLQLASDVGTAMTKAYLKNNINVIVEKAFTRERFLKSFIKNLRGKAKIFVYQIEAPIKIRTIRVKKRPLPPDSKLKPTKKKIKSNTKHYHLYKYKKAKVFDSTKLTPNKIVKEILKDIK